MSPPIIPSACPRVVSLVPGATEVLCALGAASTLVGRSHACDYPPQVLSLPAVTGSNITPGDPEAVDAQVGVARSRAQPLTSLFADRLRALRPDVVVTSDQSGVDPAVLAESLDACPNRPRLVDASSSTVEGTLDTFLTVGQSIGRAEDARALVVGLRERFFAANEFVNPYDDGPVTVFLAWTHPLICAGGWTVQLLERAGARHPLNPTIPRPTAGAAAGPQFAERTAGPTVRISPSALAEIDPQRLIICPCGMDLDQTRRCVERLSREEWWSALRAVREGHIALVDGRQMFHRPGPRLIDAFEWLVALMNGVPALMPRAFPWEAATGPSP